MNEPILSAAITSVPNRREHVRDYMLPALKEMNIPTVNCVDAQFQGYTWNTDRAWLSYSPESTHHLVLEDDILFCEGFKEAVMDAIRARPNDCIVLFNTGARPNYKRAIKLGYSWAGQEELYWNQAVCMPRSMIAKSQAWTNLHVKPYSTKLCDIKFSLYLFCNKLVCYYTIPCLVQHIGSFQSAMGHNTFNITAGQWTGKGTNSFSDLRSVTHHKNLQLDPAYWNYYIP